MNLIINKRNDSKLNPYIVLVIMFLIQLFTNLFLPGRWNDTWLNGIGIDIKNGAIGWDVIVDIHKTLSVFAARVFTTKLLDFSFNNLGLSRLVTYIILSTTAYFISGLYIIKITKFYSANKKIISLTVIIYFLSFSNIFYQMTPLYTYDDPFQYLFIIMGTYYLLKNNYILLIITAFLASYVRETTVLVFPAWILLKWMRNKSIPWKVTLSLFIAGILYLIANYYTQIAVGVLEVNKEYMTTSRFPHFRQNFRSIVATGSTLASFLNIMLFPLGLIIIHKKRLLKENRQLLFTFLLVFILNTPIVFLVTKARESRLFTLPMIFLWPLYGVILAPWVENLKKYAKVHIIFVLGLVMYALLILVFCIEKNFKFSRFIHIISILLFLTSNYLYTKQEQMDKKF